MENAAVQASVPRASCSQPRVRRFLTAALYAALPYTKKLLHSVRRAAIPVSISCHSAHRNDGDAVRIRERCNVLPVHDERPVCLDGECLRPDRNHAAQRILADRRHIKAAVLLWFCDLDDDRPAARELAAARDARRAGVKIEKKSSLPPSVAAILARAKAKAAERGTQ